jgi:hypothetical protein
VSCVFGASVALHLVNSSVKLYNVTFVDNSTKSVLNVSESISALNIRDEDVILNFSQFLFTFPINVVIYVFFIG